MNTPPTTASASAQASQPSNPSAVPTGEEGPATKDTRTVLQQLATLRDTLVTLYPKHTVTVRLDVTSAAPGTEYLAFCDGIPNIPDRPKRYGTLRAETFRDLETQVLSLHP